MSKKVSEDLFDLIKSLNKNEKGYFKKYSSINSSQYSTSYIQLFDTIDRQEVYDEEVIQKKQNFNRLPHLKKYLYKQILKSLRSYNSERKIVDILLVTRNDIENLYAKKLFKQAHLLLLKTKSLAYQYEQFLIVLKLIQIDKQMLRRSNLQDDVFLLKVINEEKIVLENLKIEKKYNDFVDVLFIKLNNRKPNTDKAEITRIKAIGTDLFKNKDYLKTFKSKTYFYWASTIYYVLIGEGFKGVASMSKNILTIEENPLQLKERVDYYFNGLYNYFYIAYLVKDFETCNIAVHKFEIIRKSFIVENESFYPQFLNLQLIMFIEGSVNEKLLSLCDKLIKFLNETNLLIPKYHLLEYYFNISISYFYCAMYSKAIAYLNKIINTDLSSENIRPDIKITAHTIKIILNYELGNNNLCLSSLNSLSYILKKYNYSSDFLNSFKVYYKTIIELDNTNSIRKTNLEFLKSIKSIKQIDTTDKQLALFDYESWIESKTTTNTFQEIRKVKSKWKIN